MYTPELMKILDFASTVACFRGEKKQSGCSCPPCLARTIRFGTNMVGIPQMEAIRANSKNY